MTTLIPPQHHPPSAMHHTSSLWVTSPSSRVGRCTDNKYIIKLCWCRSSTHSTIASGTPPPTHTHTPTHPPTHTHDPTGLLQPLSFHQHMFPCPGVCLQVADNGKGVPPEGPCCTQSQVPHTQYITGLVDPLSVHTPMLPSLFTYPHTHVFNT